MKHNKHHEAIIAFVRKHPNSATSTIVEGLPKLSTKIINLSMKQLMEESSVTHNEDTGTYSIATKNAVAQPKEIKVDKKEAEKQEAKVTSKTSIAKEESDLGPKHLPGQPARDNTKYSLLNGTDGKPQHGLGKSRLVLAILQAYCQRNPKVSLSKLEEVFASKRIQVRYGCFATVQTAKGFSKNGRHRYFMDNVIKVGPQKTPVVSCNQWDLKNTTEFIKVAKELGMKIQVTAKK